LKKVLREIDVSEGFFDCANGPELIIPVIFYSCREPEALSHANVIHIFNPEYLSLSA
jgi:hypothetical protein